jgi:type II secretory pathway pseudopilin PulG
MNQSMNRLLGHELARMNHRSMVRSAEFNSAWSDPLRRTRPRCRGGFTLIELLVIVGMIALGASLLVPALARMRPNSQAFQCVNNLKQLITAWQMYAEDNKGRLVMVLHGGDAFGGASALNPNNAPWATGWLD